MLSTEISNSEDIIDSRDVIARIDWLEDSEDEQEQEERQALLDLQEEASGSPDWPYGEALIRDSYFTEYAEQLADDIGATNGQESHGWPLCHIDWEAAADALKQDYVCVEFDGVEYWIRA